MTYTDRIDSKAKLHVERSSVNVVVHTQRAGKADHDIDRNNGLPS